MVCTYATAASAQVKLVRTLKAMYLNVLLEAATACVFDLMAYAYVALRHFAYAVQLLDFLVD